MTASERAREYITPGWNMGTGSVEIIRDLLAENERMRAAIITCLDNNGHLADGDDCTLIDLKRAVPEWDGAPLGVYGAKTLAILESL